MYALSYPVSRAAYMYWALSWYRGLLAVAALLLGLLLLLATLGINAMSEQGFVPGLRMAFWITVSGCAGRCGAGGSVFLMIASLSTVPMLRGRTWNGICLCRKRPRRRNRLSAAWR